MQWSSDRTGFPVVELPEAGTGVHLLPVTKFQFERFLAEPVAGQLHTAPEIPLFGDAWYESILAVSPRVPLRAATIDTYESQFLGGAHPEEFESFARWLGREYDLPRPETWRKVDAAFSEEPLSDGDAVSLRTDARLARSARALLSWWIDVRRPQRWSELALLQGGLLEWVRMGPRNFGGLGRPRPEFRGILINPQRDDPVKPIQQRRLAYFGARLVRSL